MHVLILPSWYPETPDDVDGIFFRQQAQALQRSGLKVGVVAPLFRSMRGKPETILSANYGFDDYVEQDVPTYVYHSMYFFPRTRLDQRRWVNAGKKLFKRYVAKHGRPDVLHAHSMNHGGILAHAIHQQTGIPYVITEHSSTYARKLIHDWQRPGMQAAAEACASRLAVSHEFCTLLKREYQGLEWQYLPNILSAPFEAPVNLAAKPANDVFTFCSVAHLQPKKGFDILLPAFAEALKARPQMQLKIGGTGPEAAKLQQLAENLNLGAPVTFLGGLKNDEVLALMYASDAFVLASRVETFGVVFIEALSQGLPVIATRCGGPESIVTPDNGILIPTENPQALAEALVRLYDTRSRYAAADLRQACLNEFGERSIVDQLTRQYRAAAARHSV
ncbi:glycosyltransferase [Uruburuella testudinis]|uniref:Glycosyltransferase n=1 Tax=Uruburuella testudinis TaxID=1282863 RepID=A0ABY4DUI9_9NEIS|nr:glycosyltransferase [Uruburuella testudinis]UOO82379.1 glycosyltransferase [Uruburuella testudinis]